MKKIALIISLLPIVVIAQTESEFYDNGNLKVEYFRDSVGRIVSENDYFETGEFSSKVYFDTTGAMADFYSLDKNGDTLHTSNIPKFKSQPKTDLSFIKWKKSRSGIEYCIVNKGNKNKPKDGDNVRLWYIGYFPHGGQFDNCDITGNVYEFELGKGLTIEGFEYAIKELYYGGEGYIKIPPELGYGSEPSGNIPGNSTLIYHIKFVE